MTEENEKEKEKDKPIFTEQPLTSSEDEEQDIMTKSDQEKIMEMLLNEDAVPKEIKKDLWGMTDKEIALTFFDENDADIAMDMIEDSMLSFITSLKPSQYTFEKDRDLTQLRLKAFAKIKRSVGTDKPKMNERTAIISHMRGEFGDRPLTRKMGLVDRLIGRRRE